MGQRANSGRNASLDDKKERMEGREQNDPARKSIADAQGGPHGGEAKGKTAGAFGKDGVANRPAAGTPQAAGGGGASGINGSDT